MRCIMANLIRSAKSGNDWAQNDLRAYNIRVVFQDATTFFCGLLPEPAVRRPEVLTTPNSSDAQDDDVFAFLRTLELSTSGPPNEESAVDDFAVNLFHELGYTGRGRVARTRKDIRFVICGEERYAKTDVCLIDANDVLLLLVQEDKRYLEGSDPEPQLIAEAIAAFSAHNFDRIRALGLPALEEKVLPGITMTGTMPTFYKIPVTTALAHAVEEGQYPAQETVVYAHLPEVPRHQQRFQEGMKPLDNRRILLSCYEAFKQFVQ